jgi:PAS domain S-box-containing protein
MVRYANPSFLRMFECSHDEIVGQSLATLFSSIGIRDLSDVITVIDISKNHTNEFVVKTKQNRRLVVKVAASNVTTRSGAEVGRMASFVDITKRKELEMKRENLIAGLKEALDKIKTLKGIIPICASCKKTRGDAGYWNDVERCIKEHSEAEFSQGICSQCAHRLYQEYDL